MWRGSRPGTSRRPGHRRPPRVIRRSSRRAGRAARRPASRSRLGTRRRARGRRPGKAWAETLVGRGRTPEEQKVVEVDERSRPACVRRSRGRCRRSLGEVVRPRGDVGNHLRDGPPRVDRPRVEIGEPAPCGGAASRGRGMPRLLATISMTSAASAGSSTGESLGEAERRRVAPERPMATAWNVPPTTRAADWASASVRASSAAVRCNIWRAARRVKVRRRIRSGAVPCASSTRRVRTTSSSCPCPLPPGPAKDPRHG